MKKSPIYPGYEGGDCGFDPQMDFFTVPNFDIINFDRFAFNQFLEEARKNASEEHYVTTPQHRVDAHRNQSDEVKKDRKSWKRSLFSWWKAGKKSNSTLQPTTNPSIPKPKRGPVCVSGPIYGSGGGNSCQLRRQTSGPIKSVFHLTTEVENEIPYMCLDKLDNPRCVQSYGPVYLVT